MICLSICGISEDVKAYNQDTADAIADICIKEWDTYGILPSVALGQAFVESGLGSGGSNLFGVNGCRGLGPVSATYRYLQCLHNGYFKGTMAFKKTPEEQMYYILERGNYCAGEYPYGQYYYNVINSIYHYGWDHYDDILKKIKAREKAKRNKQSLRAMRQLGLFTLCYSNQLSPGTAIVDGDYIKKGSTIISPAGIFEVVRTNRNLKSTILVGDPRLIKRIDKNWRDELSRFTEGDEEIYFRKDNIEVIEDAKG